MILLGLPSVQVFGFVSFAPLPLLLFHQVRDWFRVKHCSVQAKIQYVWWVR